MRKEPRTMDPDNVIKYWWKRMWPVWLIYATAALLLWAVGIWPGPSG